MMMVHVHIQLCFFFFLLLELLFLLPHIFFPPQNTHTYIHGNITHRYIHKHSHIEWMGIEEIVTNKKKKKQTKKKTIPNIKYIIFEKWTLCYVQSNRDINGTPIHDMPYIYIHQPFRMRMTVCLCVLHPRIPLITYIMHMYTPWT